MNKKEIKAISNTIANDMIAKKAIKQFGMSNQREMLVEECSELIMAVQKLKRIEKSSKRYKMTFADEMLARKDNFAEEMADVSIMILQFRMSDEKLNNKFLKYFNAKMERLEKRLNK